jgi:hypothetical protein
MSSVFSKRRMAKYGVYAIFAILLLLSKYFLFFRVRSWRFTRKLSLSCPFELPVFCLYKSLDAPPIQMYPDDKYETAAATSASDNYIDSHRLAPPSQRQRQHDELLAARTKIEELEQRISYLENHIPKKYPDVKFQNYKNRKRILVSGQENQWI